MNHLIKFRKLYSFILFVIVLSFPYLLRFLQGNYLLIGRESSFHLYQINYLPQSIIPAYMALLAVASFLLICSLLERFRISAKQKLFFLVLLILSPAFIYMYTTLNHHALVLFLLLSAFYLLHERWGYLALVPLALIPFIDLFSALLAVLLLDIFYYFKNKDEKQRWFSFSYLKKDRQAKVIFSIMIVLILFNLDQFFLGPFYQQDFLKDLFAELGGHVGTSLFLLLLSLIGLGKVWKREKLFLAYLLVPLVVVFFFNTSVMVYLNFIIVFLASFGLVNLSSRDWKLNSVKNVTIFVVFLGIVFASLLSISNLAESKPTPRMLESLDFLERHSLDQDIIFSSPEDSYYIENFAQRKAFIYFDDQDYRERSALFRTVMESTYIQDTFPILDDNNISFIYLSKDISTEEGLGFLFQNENFKRIYSQDNIEIWEYGTSD